MGVCHKCGGEVPHPETAFPVCASCGRYPWGLSDKKKRGAVATMRCGRCHFVIRSVEIEVSADGEFEVKGLPNQCTSPSCQAGFGSRTDHALEVTIRLVDA